MADPRIPDVTSVASPPRRELVYRELVVDDEPLGTGGQGLVYRAEVDDESPPSHVALKQPDGSGTLTDADVADFFREAETWATVDQREREQPRWAESEHIVGVVDTGDGLPWIALEFMDGGSLAHRLANRSEGLPIDEALWIGESVCRGLEVAHNYGVAHLDLKPENVLFRATAEGTWDVPKIADWGLARVLSRGTETSGGLSVQFAAPEQFEPEAFGDPDMLTDVYQAGALVYTLLTGRPPYVGSHASVKQDVTDSDAPTPPSRFRSELSGAIDATVLRALATQKRDRYDAIQLFRQALAAARTDSQLPRTVARSVSETAESASPTLDRNRDSNDETTTSATSEASADSAGRRDSTDTSTSASADPTSPETDSGDGNGGDVSDRSRTTHDPKEESEDQTTIDSDTRDQHENDDERGWFDPERYPEASTRSLASALDESRDYGGTESIAEGLESLPDDSLVSRLETMHSTIDERRSPD